MTIDGDPDVVEPCKFGKDVYVSVFYCVCYEMDISTYMSEEQVTEEIYTDLDDEESSRMDNSGEEHWRDFSEEGENKKNIHDLRWDVYINDK